MQWDAWTEGPFPSDALDIEIDGIDLTSLDTVSAGCISAFVGNRGELDQERIEILRNCTSDLEIALGMLAGDIKVYFTELSERSHKVLGSADCLEAA
jgi:hypothetical protein